MKIKKTGVKISVMFIALSLIVGALFYTQTSYGKIAVNENLASFLKVFRGKYAGDAARYEQDRVNAHYKVGEKLKAKVSPENAKVVLAHINDETITLNDFNYLKCSKEIRALVGYEPPTDNQIFGSLVEKKLQVSAARRMGLYPTKEQIDAYVEEQKRLAAEYKPKDLDNLIRGWGLTYDEYYSIMRSTWADSLAVTNWCRAVVQKNVVQLPGEDHSQYVNRLEEYRRNEVAKLKAEAQIEVTPEGLAMGLQVN